jgi:hypothetical protein
MLYRRAALKDHCYEICAALKIRLRLGFLCESLAGSPGPRILKLLPEYANRKTKQATFSGLKRGNTGRSQRESVQFRRRRFTERHGFMYQYGSLSIVCGWKSLMGILTRKVQFSVYNPLPPRPI